MSDYNSENTIVLATHVQAGNNARMLLLHEFEESHRVEYVIGSYFHATRYDGALGYERWDFEWDWGHYYSAFEDAARAWLEIVGEGSES